MGDDACPPGHERLSLAEAVEQMMQEARMLLPGVQALFGFQLVGAFQQRFDDLLSPAERTLYLVALALTAAAGGLIMAPAAYHRHGNPFEVSVHLLRAGSRLLAVSLPFLGTAMCLDVYLVARVTTDSRPAAGALAAGLGLVLGGLWEVLPRSRRLRRWLGD